MTAHFNDTGRRVGVVAFLLLLLWLLAGCRASKPDRAAGTDPTGPYVPVVVRPDTASQDNPTPPQAPITEPSKQGVLAKIWPFKQDKKNTSLPRTFLNPTQPPRKCKGCTIINAAPGATVTTTTVAKKATAATGAGATATSIGKAKAPVTTGTGDATDQRGTGAASTIKGNNNAPVLTNAPVEAPDWKAQLATGFATPVGKVLAVLLLASVGYGVWRLWPVLRKKSTNTQV